MKTLTVRGEIGSDGKLHIELPDDLPPGPVEVTVRTLPPSGGPHPNLVQSLRDAHARLEAADSSFMTDAEIHSALEEMRSDDRMDEIYRRVEAERRPSEGA